MFKKIILAIALMVFATSVSQNANLDREYVKVSYIKLPAKPILDNNKRSFSSNDRSISLLGFSRVETNGTIDIVYNYNGTQISDVEINKTKHEDKDKEGNIISVSYTYNVHAQYSSSANISVNNAYNPENGYQKNLIKTDEYLSKSFSSHNEAQNYYNRNKYNIKNDYAAEHKIEMTNNVNYTLNQLYGYVSKSRNDQFWILGNKKHPEYQKHMETYETMKTIFDKMKYDVPIDVLKAELQPSIAYFEGLIPKYVGTKKRMKKMRYASYYNIAKMYYYLDMPEKTKEYAQKLIANDYGKSDGKQLIRLSNQLIEDFRINKIKSRHFEILTEDLTHSGHDQRPTNAEAFLDPGTELVKAYVITKSNDTTVVDMKISDVDRIGHSIKTIKYNDINTPVGVEVIWALEISEVLFIDGTHYKNLTFKDASTSAVDKATSKLCKVIYESDKINLYQFKISEPVFEFPENNKIQSTRTTTYVFGFNKNLAKLAEGCPQLLENVKAKHFKNNIDDLKVFCNRLTTCN